MSLLITIGAFLFAIGVLTTVHEFGHFWVARKLGVKVLKFSVGFGRALFSWRSRRDGVEYVIAVLPLGGYVKMLDEREAEVAAAEVDRAFNRQPLAKRTAIAAAGPAFNLLFAVLAYWCVLMSGIPGVRPLIGSVAPQSPAAQAGLRAGDEIVSVNGTTTPTWEAASLALLDGVMDQQTLDVTAKQSGSAPRKLRLHVHDVNALTRPGGLLPGLGLEPWQLPAVVARLVPDGPAARSGVQSGDRVIEIGGKPISGWSALVQFVRAHPGETVPAKVQRNGAQIPLQLQIGGRTENGQRVGFIGVEVSEAGRDRLLSVERYAPLPALGHAFGKTGEISWLTLRMLWDMANGTASWKNLSGPIGIAQYAGAAVSAGATAFATFLAVISISLGILNLLPVPVLDGGHLLFYAIEWIKGGPLSTRTEVIGQQIGITLLLLLMGFVVFNDLARIMG